MEERVFAFVSFAADVCRVESTSEILRLGK